MRPPIDSAADTARKYERDVEDVAKYRSSHRYPKHRSRLKPELSVDDLPRRSNYRDRKDDVSDIDSKDYFPVDKDDFQDDKSKDFDDEVKFVNEVTTRRAPRRKPRDRFIKRKSSNLDFAYDDDDLLDQRPKSEDETARRTRPSEHEAGEARPHMRGHFRPAPLDDEEARVHVQPLSKTKHKPYEDYDDYYDMKRVNSIKNKLPQLLRRPTTGTCATHSLSWIHRQDLPLAASSNC